METGIDCQKYRKSTHLARIDIEAIIAEKGTCEFTIKNAYYDKGVDVNGRKTDGYFLKFEEPSKEFMPNSGNRTKIAKLVKDEKKCTAVESRNISNWIGMKIRLLADETIKMKGEVVGGIVVDEKYNQPVKLTFQQAKDAFDKVNSRDSFVAAQTKFAEFLSNAEILALCKSLSVTYPKPIDK